MDSNQPSRPVVYDLLLGTPNQAADDALVAALPDMEPPYQAQALALLLARNREPALAAVVARLPVCRESLRREIIRQASALAAGVRTCMKDEQFEVRQAAIDVIRESGSGHLTYLLADALSQPCRKTAELAARALLHLVEYLPRDATRYACSRQAMPRRDRDYFVQAVRRSLSSWSAHFRGDVAAAAVRLAGDLEDTIIRMADDPRTKVDRAFAALGGAGRFPVAAAFQMRALRSRQLREQAVRAIGAIADDESRDALLDESWLLADDAVRKSFVRVRSLDFMPAGEAGAPAYGQRGRAAVRVIASAGLGAGRKVAMLRSLATGHEPIASRAATWALIENRIEGSDDALRAIAMRGDSPLAELVKLELRRRNGERLATTKTREAEPATTATATHKSEETPFDAFWSEFDGIAHEARRTVVAAVRVGSDEFDQRLRTKLAHASSEQRLRALKVISAMPNCAGFEEAICAAARDADVMVRSLAVRLLAGVDTGAARGLLRAALNDPDDRVQANAVEAFGQIDPGALRDRFEMEFASAGNRARANAVRALLRTHLREGIDRLLDMLLSDNAADRISALWVVERVRLAGVAEVLRGVAEGDPDERVRRRAKRILLAVTDDEEQTDDAVPAGREATA